MNIAIFTDNYFPNINGVSSSIYTLANGLIEKGHKVYIFSISDPSKKIKLVETNPIVYRVPSVSLIFVKPYRAVKPYYIGVVSLCRKFKIDIIHSQTEFSMGVMGHLIAKTLGIPHIHTYHTMWEDYTHYITHGLKVVDVPAKTVARKISSSYCESANTLIVPTEKVRQSIISYGVDMPTYVIPSGINLKPFSSESINKERIEEIKKEWKILPTDKVLLSIGRVAHEKSIDMIIRQMPEILKRNPNILFIVVGDGPATEDLKQLASELNLGDRIRFPGFVPYSEVATYYHVGDAFISCSTSETQGLTYYEALASGLPVIARYDDCIADILNDGINSRVFNDPSNLPDIVADIFNNSDTYNKLASNAASSVKDFDSDVFANKVEVAYIETINRYNKRHAERDANALIHIKYEASKNIEDNLFRAYRTFNKFTKPIERKTDHSKRKIRKIYKTTKDILSDL